MKRKARVDIRAYLSKTKLSDVPNGNDQRNDLEAADGVNEVDSVPPDLEPEVSTATITAINDIADGLEINPWTPELRFKFLTQCWVPGENYIFPLKEQGGQRRKFNRQWMNQYSWLSYSQLKQGGFCKFCVIFGNDSGGTNDQKLGRFVTTAWCKYNKAQEDLRGHCSNNYHLLNAEKAGNFLRIYEDSSKRESVAAQINRQQAEAIQMNRRRLRPIVQTVLLCARLCLPLRGHRESGDLSDPLIRDACLQGQQGVFRGLLSFRVDAGDKELRSHLETASKRSTWTGKNIQNDVIECIGSIIQGQIISKVKKSKFFCLICDETTDAGRREQLSICLRYVDMDTYTLREDFLLFDQQESTTGEALTASIKKALAGHGINVEFLRGQSYDGGSNMAGKFRGVQALILKEQPLALYTHCLNHSLNLVISKSCEERYVKNMLGIVSQVSVFFTASALRVLALERVVEELGGAAAARLKPDCKTRWVERHDSVKVVRDLYKFILEALRRIQVSSDDAQASGLASCYESGMLRGDFIVSLEMVATVMTHTGMLSEYLQSPEVDLGQAMEKVNLVLSVMQELRDQPEVSFHPIFAAAEATAREVGVSIVMPRVVGRQAHRSNIAAQNAEEYFLRNAYIPYLDHIILEMTKRFDERLITVLPLVGIIPSRLGKFSDEDILQAASFYQKDLPAKSDLELKSELALWRCKWRNSQDLPKSAVEALAKSDELTPNLRVLLQIFATLPVSTATAERSFSTLNRLKTFLRSTMTEDRLNGLALANIHKEIVVDVEEVINAFAGMKPRRMQLTTWDD